MAHKGPDKYFRKGLSLVDLTLCWRVCGTAQHSWRRYGRPDDDYREEHGRQAVAL